MNGGVGGLLGTAAGEPAARPALRWGGQELSYPRLAALAEGLAGRLEQAAGPTDLAGARIAVIAPNVPALAAAVFAAWRLGAVAVPLNARLREHELAGALADAEPIALVAVAAHGGYDFGALLGNLIPRLPSVRACLLVGPGGEVERELPGGPGVPVEPLGQEFAALLYTSGTTGAPRAALVRHSREVEGASRLAGLLRLGQEDRVALVVPISHAFGLTSFLATIAAGATTILVDSTFSPGPLLRAVEEQRATILHGSPTLFSGLLKARPDGVSGIRSGLVAGAPAPPALLESLDDRGMRMLNLYGLTEAGAVAACRLDDPRALRFTTVGRPFAGFEVRLGPEGVLELRGPSVTPGYFGRADDGAAFADGWFRTGDLATLEDGYLRIVGRVKEIVHVGGFNVVPAEVEAVLLEHPDVLQAVVIGRPDERMGEALQAFVVAREESGLMPADLVRFARSRIAGYKVPYALRMLPTLPLLSSGKPDRPGACKPLGERQRGGRGARAGHPSSRASIPRRWPASRRR